MKAWRTAWRDRKEKGPAFLWSWCRRNVTAGWCLIVLLGAAAGCGTIVQGTDQTILLTSEPSGVEVHDQGRSLAVATPVEVRLTRGSSHALTFSKQGYKPAKVTMVRQMILKWWILDAFSLGIGNIVDLSTGAMFQIRPGNVHVVLDAMEDAPSGRRDLQSTL